MRISPTFGQTNGIKSYTNYADYRQDLLRIQNWPGFQRVLNSDPENGKGNYEALMATKNASPSAHPLRIIWSVITSKPEEESKALEFIAAEDISKI